MSDFTVSKEEQNRLILALTPMLQPLRAKVGISQGELAPILGLSDVIVDIVETGTTLKENNLAVLETIVPISARLIANKASYVFYKARIEELVRAISREVET